jgi:hypothetical protein
VDEGELIFGPYTRVEFLRYTTFRDGNDCFLVRVYAFRQSKGTKKQKVAMCINCAQPATHACEGCGRHRFCSDPQCASAVEAHLAACE